MVPRDRFESNTTTLRDLFKKAESSGKIAWEIGNLLVDVHDNRLYQARYVSFEEYTQTEFNKSGQTARAYILIRKRFRQADITDDILVTHLNAIVDFYDSEVGDLILRALAIFGSQEAVKEANLSPSTKDIKLSMILMSKSKSMNEVQATKLLEAVVRESKKRISAKKKKKTPQDLFGRRLESPGFPEISNLFENEPIDEMGTVALFCMMFPLIKGISFELDGEKLSFVSIQYVRAPFPDSSIRVKKEKVKNPKFKYLKVEFEFDSYNYIRHGHFNATNSEECDLIICWKDSIAENPLVPDALKQELPGIMEISDILDSGKIVIRNGMREETKIVANTP